MLHYATAVHTILSHCLIFVNLTLPSSSVRAPFLVLCHLSGSQACPPISAPRQSWLRVMEQRLEYCWRKNVTKDPSLMPCWPDIDLESWIGIRFPEEKAEVLAWGFWSLARGLGSRTARSGWKEMTVSTCGHIRDYLTLAGKHCLTLELSHGWS